MKRFLLVALAVSCAVPASARNVPWLMGTADTLPAGRIEMGLFSPLRIGVTDEIELNIHPVLAALNPHLTARLAWTDCLTSEHTVSYPTPLLMMLSREGTGGLLPATTKVPHILHMSHYALFTIHMADEYLFTLKGGVHVAGTAGESTLVSIDLPLIFPRTSAWFNGFTAVVGLDFDGLIWGPLYYSVDADLFVMPDPEAPLHFEHSLMISWVTGHVFKLDLGYKLIYGMYPFGEQFHMLPMIDFVFNLKSE